MRVHLYKSYLFINVVIYVKVSTALLRRVKRLGVKIQTHSSLRYIGVTSSLASRRRSSSSSSSSTELLTDDDGDDSENESDSPPGSQVTCLLACRFTVTLSSITSVLYTDTVACICSLQRSRTAFCVFSCAYCGIASGERICCDSGSALSDRLYFTRLSLLHAL
jgi:hypothetical protein